MKKKSKIAIAVGGPCAGTLFRVDGPQQIILTPADPFYIGAIYELTNKSTKLGEVIALFNHCLRRNNE